MIKHIFKFLIPLSYRKLVLLIFGLSIFGLIFSLGSNFLILAVHAEPAVAVDQAQAFPTSAADLYRGDPWYELKINAEQEMGLFLVEPPRRHASEVTQYSNDHLHFHLWRPISENNQEAWSRALGWLLFGRIKYSRGAQHLFAELPSLKRITLSLHEVERAQNAKTLGCVAKKGKRKAHQQKRKNSGKSKQDLVQTYLTISLTRENFENIDIERVKQCVRLLDCDQEVRKMMSLLKWNTRYLKSRAQ